MPFLEKSVSMVTGRMPKVIPPGIHAITDYAIAGSFIVVGAASWRHHKRAAISAFAVAGAIVVLAALTDYPGGVVKKVSLPTHLKVDAGRSGVIGSIPSLAGFSGSWPSWFFRSQAVAMEAIAGLTRVTTTGEDLRAQAA